MARCDGKPPYLLATDAWAEQSFKTSVFLARRVHDRSHGQHTLSSASIWVYSMPQGEVAGWGMDVRLDVRRAAVTVTRRA
jgi:hypothetical protein